MLFRKAILIIHGFAGGTYDQEELGNLLQLNKNFDVFQFTLPGHEKNLSKVSYEDWIDESERQIKWIIGNGYKDIYLIGHSMGGVIATYLATKYKNVKKLVLLAPAFQYFSVVKEQINISDSIKLTPKIFKTYGSDEIIARLLKLNLSATKEFMDLVKNYYDCPKFIKCQTLILQGKEDDIVPEESAKYVYDTIKSYNKKLIYLNGVTHDICKAENKFKIYTLIERFLKFGTLGGIDII